jgi:CheY-like chemotaxis protein
MGGSMSSKCILIIDDEPDIREIAKISLTITKQWEILTASSGFQGIEIASASQPNAILLDLIMPELDGLTTLRELKKNHLTADIPVILLTATTKIAMQSDYVQWDAKGILSKPFDPGSLGGQIEEILGWEKLIVD